MVLIVKSIRLTINLLGIKHRNTERIGEMITRKEAKTENITYGNVVVQATGEFVPYPNEDKRIN